MLTGSGGRPGALTGRERQGAACSAAAFCSLQFSGGSCCPVTGLAFAEKHEATFHIFLIFWLSCKNSSMGKFKHCANQAAC